MNILILHHFSDYWSYGLEKLGTDFETELAKVMDYIRNEPINKIILPLFEEYQLQDCHSSLANYCGQNGIKLEVHEYNYAWSRESDHNNDIYTEENFNKTWCHGTREHHQEDMDVIEIDQWQHDLKTANKVIVAGAFEDECILDLTSALDAIEVDYEREDSLIVGAYVEYEFRGLSSEDICERMDIHLTELEEKVTDKVTEIEEEFDEVICDLDDLFNFAPHFVTEIEDGVNAIYEEED